MCNQELVHSKGGRSELDQGHTTQMEEGLPQPCRCLSILQVVWTTVKLCVACVADMSQRMPPYNHDTSKVWCMDGTRLGMWHRTTVLMFVARTVGGALTSRAPLRGTKKDVQSYCPIKCTI